MAGSARCAPRLAASRDRARAQARPDRGLWGGAYQVGCARFLPPLAAGTQPPLLEETWECGVGVLRASPPVGANSWDLVQVESEELLIGCEEGLFERLDFSAIAGGPLYPHRGA